MQGFLTDQVILKAMELGGVFVICVGLIYFFFKRDEKSMNLFIDLIRQIGETNTKSVTAIENNTQALHELKEILEDVKREVSKEDE